MSNAKESLTVDTLVFHESGECILRESIQTTDITYSSTRCEEIMKEHPRAAHVAQRDQHHGFEWFLLSRSDIESWM